MTAPRRVGVVGLGVISRFYRKAIELTPGWCLSALCDLAPQRLADHPNDVACFTDHRAMLREAGLDAVIVTAPNDTHATVTRDALAAGLAVCVEKPLATNLSEAESLARLARERGLCLFTAFHRRYNREISALRRQVARGKVTSVTVRYAELIEEHLGADRWYLDPTRCGGGVVADNGPNAFDLVRMLLGDVTVVAASVDRDTHGLDRRASIELAAATGIRAQVELDWSFPGECKDVEVILDDGRRVYADMLADCVEFKQSLWHEYVGVLADFDRHIRALTADGSMPASRPRNASDGAAGPDGVAALALVAETYRLADAAREPIAVGGLVGEGER
jgi:predicted dehydrogenase